MIKIVSADGTEDLIGPSEWVLCEEILGGTDFVSKSIDDEKVVSLYCEVDKSDFGRLAKKD